MESIRSNEIVVNFKVKDDGIYISESKLDAIFKSVIQIEGIENSELKGLVLVYILVSYWLIKWEGTLLLIV